MLEKEILAIESIIGYEFNNTNLIEEAYEASLSKEDYLNFHDELSYSSDLIFLATSALDSAVVSFIAAIYGNNDEIFTFTRDKGYILNLKRAILNKYQYAKRLKSLGLNKFMLKHKRLYSKNEEFDIMANLFLAIIGAVVADSGYNMQTISKVVNNMLDPLEVALSLDGIDYLAEIEKWYKDNYEADLSFEVIKRDNRYEAILTIPNQNDMDLYSELGLCYSETEAVNGFGFTELQAKRDACRRSFRYLRNMDKLDFSIMTKDKNKLKEIIDSKSDGRAKEAIASLVKNGLLSRPLLNVEFDKFLKEYHAILSLEEYDFSFVGKAKSQEKAIEESYKELYKQIYNDIYDKKHRSNKASEDLPF